LEGKPAFVLLQGQSSKFCRNEFLSVFQDERRPGLYAKMEYV